MWKARAPGVVAAVLVLSGCASGSAPRAEPAVAEPVTAEAKDLPDHFMVVASGFVQKSEPKPGEGCRNPMVDPRNGTTLNLVRSKDGKGDYQVMGLDYELKTQYGVDPRHLLRVDCATGKALGIVSQ